jgi:hypothetical protein
MQEFIDHFKKPKFWHDIVKVALTAALGTFISHQVSKACKK